MKEKKKGKEKILSSRLRRNKDQEEELKVI